MFTCPLGWGENMATVAPTIQQTPEVGAAGSAEVAGNDLQTGNRRWRVAAPLAPLPLADFDEMPRRSERAFAVLLVARVASPTHDDLALVRDISPFGARIRTRVPLIAGMTVNLEFGDMLTAAGTVRWVTSSHAGVEFTAPVDIGCVLVKPGAERKVFGAEARRAVPRIRRCGDVRLWHGGQAHGGTIIDLSPRGCRIELFGNDTPATGDWVAVEVKGFAEREASVRWVRGRELGLSFDKAIPLWDLDEWLYAETGKCHDCSTVECSAPSFNLSLRGSLSVRGGEQG